MSEEFLAQKSGRRTALRWVLLLSGTALAGLLSTKGNLIWVAAGIPLAMAALAILIFRFRFLERTFAVRVRWIAILSGILALYAAYCYGDLFYYHMQSLAGELTSATAVGLLSRFGLIFTIIAAVVSIPAMFVYLYWFFCWFSERMREVFRASDRVERWYLIIAFVLFALAISLVYSKTSMFYAANASSDNVWDKIDIVYSSDSSMLTEQNVFYNIAASENDIRQPMFGVFAAPFALAASLVSRAVMQPSAYPAMMQILQSAFLALGLVLIVRMTGASGAVKALALVCGTLLYPTLLFLLNVEQYVFSVFWLILLVWMIVQGEERGRDTAWVAASGSMLTSGILLLILPGKGTFKEKVRQGALAVLLFALVMILLGRVAMVLSSSETIRFLVQFAGEKLPFLARAKQYSVFLASCFVAPVAEITRFPNGGAVFQQAEVTGWSIAGFVAFAAAIAGFVVNRKRVFAQICAGWAAFSLLLLCVVGWGTSENGLVLYTLYFGWAFVALIVMLITRVLEKWRAAQIGAFSVAALALLVVNAQSIAALVRFGLENYPIG